jgi:hypothetical protein
MSFLTTSDMSEKRKSKGVDIMEDRIEMMTKQIGRMAKENEDLISSLKLADADITHYRMKYEELNGVIQTAPLLGGARGGVAARIGARKKSEMEAARREEEDAKLAKDPVAANPIFHSIDGVGGAWTDANNTVTEFWTYPANNQAGPQHSPFQVGENIQFVDLSTGAAIASAGGAGEIVIDTIETGNAAAPTKYTFTATGVATTINPAGALKFGVVSEQMSRVGNQQKIERQLQTISKMNQHFKEKNEEYRKTLNEFKQGLLKISMDLSENNDVNGCNQLVNLGLFNIIDELTHLN